MLITGAGGAIGRGLAFGFAKAGAGLVLTDISAVGLHAVVNDVETTGARVEAIEADLADDNSLAAVADYFDGPTGCSVLVNNAAWFEADKPLLQTTADDWDRAYAVNLRAVGILSCEAVRHWKEHDIEGRIINISSVGAQRAHHATVIYDTTKGAIDAMTRALAVEFGSLGIRVNAIAPAAVPRTDAAPHLGHDLPLRHAGTPEDVADAAVFLASPQSSFISGQVLAVDGGLLAQLRNPLPDFYAEVP